MMREGAAIRSRKRHPRETCTHGQIFPRRERQGPFDRRRSGHAAALCLAQRYRAQQPAFRLRARAMRRLHRPSRRPGDPLLRAPAISGRQWQGVDTRRPRHAREAAPDPGRLCGGAGAPVRLLHQRLDHDGGVAAQSEKEADRRRDQGGAYRPQVPLRNAYGHPARGQARGRDDGLREAIMTRIDKASTFSRRSVLKAGGAIVVSVGTPIGLDAVVAVDAAHAQGGKPPLMPDQLSSYIAVNADGSVSAFFGKMDMGQGLFTAIGQIVAEELDVPFKAVKVIMGDTATSVNQGGASGSTGVQLGGRQMRMAAAEARRVLVEMAAAKLGLPADQLTVSWGVVHSKTTPAKQVSYAELIGGRYFNVQLEWNKEYGNALYAPGKAKPKDPKEHRIVGQPIKREDIAPAVYAQQDYCTDVKRPGMLHARMIRPAVAGAVPAKVDESSIRDIPGAKVYQDKGFLAVLADNEWDAIRAAEMLKVEWSDVKPPFVDQAALYDHIRKAPVCKREVDIKDGEVTCWTGSQKPHFVQNGISRTIGVPLDKVRSIWTVGPGSYGRSDADDAAMDAAVLAKATGRPVRVQYTRAQGHGWDPKGPASIHRARAAIDASGNVIAYEFTSKGFSRIDVNTNGGAPWDTVAGQSLGVGLKSGDGFGVPAES